jgi:hypothetical protein
LADYAGIAGTYFSEADMSSAPVPNVGGSYGGRSTFNGVIASVGNRQRNSVTFAAVEDGTSNVMCIGEMSQGFLESDGSRRDCRASRHAGAAWGAGWGGDTDWWLNITVVRWPINWNGAVDGTYCPGYQRHTIVRSSHPGGAQGALTDGSVRFLSETMDFQTFTRLCDRRDGKPVGTF